MASLTQLFQAFAPAFLDPLWLPLEILCVLGGILALFLCLDQRLRSASSSPCLIAATVILWLLAIGLFLAGNFLL